MIIAYFRLKNVIAVGKCSTSGGMRNFEFIKSSLGWIMGIGNRKVHVCLTRYFVSNFTLMLDHLPVGYL